jgi:hypothetical protein
MATSYTSLLGLALPATGELSGTWGDTVNNYISTYVDSAVAGSLAISLGADVTLTKTTGSSLGSTSSQYAVLNVTPSNSGFSVIAPAASKVYVLNNLSATYAFTFKASGQTGVTIAISEKCVVAFNGTDFVKVASTSALPAGSTTQVQYNSSGTLAGSANFTFDGTNVTTTGISTAARLVPSGSTVATNGMYLSATNNVNISTNSTNRIDFTAAGYTRPVAYADTVSAIGNTGTAQTITCTNGNVFTATLTGNCTFTLASAIATGSSSFTLILTNDATAGRTVAWSGGTFKFANGSASLSRTTTANAIDIWVFFTPDGGTTWYGNISMKNMTT